MHRRYGDRVAFYVVYIKEAHPEDGWVLTVNRQMDIALPDAATIEERTQTAGTCALRMDVRMPVLIDEIDNRVAKAYGGWPDRLYLVGRDGRIAFQGGEGPYGFDPAGLEAAIERELGTA